MKISTSERKGCFSSSTEPSGETLLPAQRLPDLTQASTLMLQGADAPRPDPSWSWRGALTRAVTAPCSWPGVTAKKRQHKAVTQEIPDYRRWAPPRGRRRSHASWPLQLGAAHPHAGGSGDQTLGASATTEHAHGSQAYNTHDASL